jgi:hypothetical protein
MLVLMLFLMLLFVVVIDDVIAVAIKAHLQWLNLHENASKISTNEHNVT